MTELHIESSTKSNRLITKRPILLVSIWCSSILSSVPSCPWSIVIRGSDWTPTGLDVVIYNVFTGVPLDSLDPLVAAITGLASIPEKIVHHADSQRRLWVIAAAAVMIRVRRATTRVAVGI